MSCGDNTGGSCCGDGASSCSCDNVPDHKMCRLSLPQSRFDIEKVKKLTDDAQFICKCCGRTANDKENLCSPVPLN